MEPLSCDVVVLGGGTAGCVVAGRLAAESDADVVVLEAGPDYGPRDSGRWPADLLDGGALVSSHSWGYDTGRLHPLRGTVELPRARVIGGCSTHNGCIAAVGCAEDYDGWARIAGDARWSADALRPLFARALERLRVRYYGEDEVGPFHRACLEAAAALGLPRADDLGDLDGGVGFGIEPVNVDGGVRVNTAFAYLDPARSRPNLRVVDRALCDRLEPAADGVEVIARRDGGELRVRGQVAVLAAGSYGSPAVLLRSGIGDPAALAPHGIRVVHDLRGVGRNLHDHPLVELDFAGSDRLREALAEAAAERFVPEEQTLGKLRSTRASGPYDLHLVPVAAPEHSLLAGRTILAVGAMEPRSRGRLTLASADPDVPPLMDHGYLTDSHDVAVLLEGSERARELAATEPLRSLVGDELVRDLDLEDALRRTHVHYYHPVGTCALGPAGDELAVCDARGRLHGLDRVVVADCSLMPVVPRANTNVPAVVIGERIADELLASL
ncbi:MAG TPA: GMC family oxidoreductase [Gaiella sp.]|jgi:choline dehydrogenase